ncbi:hypothetical protein [Fictibacillus norfolkensis]|uniref:O-antigen ligase domain-containing protein n=1 Tax=Fictibacillus norfolkensis TaxID=2762233 RepID=A0ABR8SN39_9BACL|nr:hypothetical protein [Fictibacillus norfolkensis]MBD7964911.1 hypothetical protein [Fictibacillus norfolkensis]
MQSYIYNLNNNNSKVRLSVKINFYFTCLLVIWSLTPYLMRELQQLFVILLFLGWWVTALFSILAKKPITINKTTKVIPITIIWLIIVTIYVMVQLPNFYFGNYFYIVLYYMPILFLAFYLRCGNIKIIKQLVLFTLVVLLTNSISNIMILFDNPYAAKEATGGYGLIDYSNTNVITDKSAFTIVLGIYLALLGVYFSLVKRIKILFLILTYTLLLLLLQSTFFIGLISLIIIISCYFLIRGDRVISLIKGLLFLIICTFILIFKNNVSFLINDWIVATTSNQLIITRVHLLTDLIVNFSVSGTLEARLVNIRESFVTFLENPFFGKGYVNSFISQSVGIGNHSYIFDNLAKFGIVGFFFELTVYITFIRYVTSNIDSKLRKYYYCSWSGFVFYALFNPIVFPSVGILLFFIFPLFIHYKSLTLSRDS